ncbi:hypothetical protein LCGC14_2561920 [marine sediment metagenome]|uniref:Restriction endonuclease type II HindIII n=1 Tax=marine sediment metagenome TaxID=412755 RepID=A0A0F9DCX8_9ZZZZ
MNIKIITKQQITSRNYWVNEIAELSGNFGEDSDKVAQELSQEIKANGTEALLGHLRLCGSIPEQYRHDSTEEKLYSKYTDLVIAKSFETLGLTSCVLLERADAADVECVSEAYSFVADAKAFRLSRTAKNQKDFKVQAMDTWKRGKPYAMIVCPIYQLPTRTSQIYQQASTRSVCVFSYTHLLVLLRYCLGTRSNDKVLQLLNQIFKTVDALNPTKNALSYWGAINSVILDFDSSIRYIWIEEKKASEESIFIAKEEALNYLASERERMMRFTKEEAIRESIKSSKIDNKIRTVKSVSFNSLLFSGYPLVK